jgi:hypothetical protein
MSEYAAPGPDPGAWIDPPPGNGQTREEERQKTNGLDQGDHEHTPNRAFIRRTTLCDEKDLPRRPWLAPGFLLRGAVTLLFGPPDQGKSLLLIAWSVALTIKRKWGSFAPTAPMKVLAILAEEDDDEQSARFSAALRAFGVTRADVEPYLRRLVVPDLATLLEVDGATGALKPTKAWDDLRGEIEAFRPDVVIADPLIEFHTAEENDNTKLKAVTGWFRSLARMYHLAVLLAHHSRKGDQVPGSLEMARGASATGGAVRVAYTFLEALADDVERLGILPRHRRLFCRLDRARTSQAPPSVNEADWFEKQAYVLDNGDETPALVPWEPPAAAAPGQIEMVRLLTDVANGIAPSGEPWSPQLRDTEPRSIRTLLRRHGITKQSEAVTLEALKGHGVHVATFRARAGPRQGLRTAEQLPAVAWLDGDNGSA